MVVPLGNVVPASATGTPVVATNDVRFLSAGDFDSHEARVCIHDSRVLADPDRPKHYSAQQYLRTPAEMAELFADDFGRRTITYCGGGIAASSLAFTMVRLGFTDVAIYDGSLREWTADPFLPMETSPDPDFPDQ